MATLLENGANVRCNDKYILQKLLINFDGQMANVILPHYEYNYIRSKLIPTKSASIKKLINLIICE